MVYNLTDIAANSSGLLGFTQGVNTVLMASQLGTLFLMGISVLMFMGFMWVTNDSSKSITATAFIAFSLSLLLRAVSLINNFTFFIVIIISAASVAALWPRD